MIRLLKILPLFGVAYLFTLPGVEYGSNPFPADTIRYVRWKDTTTKAPGQYVTPTQLSTAVGDTSKYLENGQAYATLIELRTGSSADSVISNAAGIMMYGNATQWDDITVDPTQTKTGAVDKPLYSADSVAYKFIADSTEYIYGSIEMPHGWKLGSDIHPHVHVLQTAAGDTAWFAMEYKWHNLGNGGWDSNWHYALMNNRELPYTSGNMMQLTESKTAILGSGKTLSSVLIYKLKRLNGYGITNSYVYNVGFHYEIDSFGSRSELTK